MCSHTPGQGKTYFFAAFIVLLLFAFALRAHGQGIEPPPSATSEPALSPSETSPTSAQSPTDSWASFDHLWSLLKAELTESEADSTKLYESLAGLQIEVAELRSSLAESTALYEQSEASRMIERDAAEARIVDAIVKGIEAEKKRKTWQTVALVVGGVAIIETALLVIAMAF